MNEKVDERNPQQRRERIEKLKKIIKGTILAAILIPTTLAIVFIILFVRERQHNAELKTQYEELYQSMESLKDDIAYTAPEQEVYSTAQVEVSPRDALEAEAETADEEELPAEDASEDDSAQMKHVYLTFDDGPSPYTNTILDILQEYDVKATFFVVGKTENTAPPLYQRIVDEGHTLGMHSFSHKYSQIYASKEAFAEDLTGIQEYLYEITGVWSRYYRFPGGSSNTASTVDMMELIKYLQEQDIVYYDWNVISGDASGTYISADEIYENCMKGINKCNNSFLLLHDTSTKATTVEALPKIIEAVQSMDNATFAQIDDSTVPVQHKQLESE